MHSGLRVFLVIAATLAAMTPAGFSQSTDSKRTVWDGVYTDPQAARGKENFETHCSSCHGSDLNGRNAAALRGDRFMDRWREDTLDGLFNFVRNSMPPRAGGSLSQDTYIDIVTHILHANEFPAGSRDLKPDMTSSIQVLRKDGPAAVPDFALVQVVGCLAQSADSTWILTNASEPIRTRNPVEPTPDDLKTSAGKALGGDTYTLLQVDYFRPDFKPESHKGHKVQAKGFLIRNPGGPRLSVTWVEMAGSSCAK